MAPQLTWNWPETAIEIGVVALVSFVIYRVVNHAIKVVVEQSVKRAERRTEGGDSRASRILAGVAGVSQSRHEARTRTLGSVLRSINAVTVLIIGVLMILKALGIPLTPLLASAGVGGVALGFGAQSLVRDYLSGIFMILEDQFGVGDFVDLGGTAGTVEEVGLRVTRLRDANGQVWYIRNGEIVRVGNLSQGWSTGAVAVPVAITADPATVLEVLNTTMDELDADPEFAEVLLERPTVAGIDTVSAGTMTAKIFAKCVPNEHFTVQRAILQRSVVALKRAGVRAPLMSSDMMPEPSH